MTSATLIAQFPHLLTVKEVADLLGCCAKTIYAKGKDIPGYMIVCGMIRFDGEVLLKYIKEQSKGKGFRL